MVKDGDTLESNKTAGRKAEDSPVIRAMTEDDAEGLTRCVTACYGDTYGVKYFYDPDKIRSFLNQGLMHSQIAVTRGGEVVGHLGIKLEHVGDITADAIAGFVAPEYRGSDTMFRLGLNLNKVQQELGLIGVQLYAMMLHNITQRRALSIGGIETGLLPAHSPASIRAKGFERSDDRARIPAILIYVPLHPAPERIVYVAERYLNMVRNLYEQLGYARLVKDHNKELNTTPASFTIDKESGLGRIQIKVHRAGYDLPDTIARLQRECMLEGTEVIYVDLPLCDPASAALVEDLRALGLFYGGIIIERGGGDLLRMQGLINARIAPDVDIIAGRNGRELLDFVMSDARDAGAV